MSTADLLCSCTEGIDDSGSLRLQGLLRKLLLPSCLATGSCNVVEIFDTRHSSTPWSDLEETLLSQCIAHLHDGVDVFSIIGIYPRKPDFWCPLLRAPLAAHPRMTCITLQQCNLRFGVFAPLINAALKQNNTLTCLQIIECNVCDTLFCGIGEAMNVNSCIVQLRFSRTTINCKGLECLVSALGKQLQALQGKTNTRVEELIIDGCLRDIGNNKKKVLLPQLMKRNNTITTLDLSRNDLSSDTLCQLLKSMQCNDSINSLNIDWNDASETTVNCLLHVLNSSSALDEVSILGNGEISSASLQAVEESMNATKQLKQFYKQMEMQVHATNSSLWPTIIEKFVHKPGFLNKVIKLLGTVSKSNGNECIGMR